MMGLQSKVQNKLFYTRINLERRIRKDHPLRAIDKTVDFNFIITRSKIVMASMAMYPYRRL